MRRPGSVRYFARRFVHLYARGEEGAVTVMMLFAVAIFCIAGAVTLDFANRARVQAALQAAADVAAASSAIRLSEPVGGETARSQARHVVRSSIGETYLADAWHMGSFELGRWDEDAASFTPNWWHPDAVRVNLSRSPRTRNGEPTLLLHLLGVREWDIRVSAVARIETEDYLTCDNPLLSLGSRLDLAGGDLFLGVCLKARASVDYGGVPGWLSAQAANLINAVLVDATVPEPPLAGLLPVSLGGDTGTGDVATLLASTARNALQISGDGLLSGTTTLHSGLSYRVSCPESGVLRIHDSLSLSNVALLSDCPVRFESAVTLEQALVVSNLLGVLPTPGGLTVPPDVVLARTQHCDPGEGAKILLYLDAGVQAAIPTLADPDSPLGAFLDETVDGAGQLLNETVNLVGGLLSDVADAVSLQAILGDIAGLCLDLDVMLAGDRVALR